MEGGRSRTKGQCGELRSRGSEDSSFFSSITVMDRVVGKPTAQRGVEWLRRDWEEMNVSPLVRALS